MWIAYVFCFFKYLQKQRYVPRYILGLIGPMRLRQTRHNHIINRTTQKTNRALWFSKDSEPGRKCMYCTFVYIPYPYLGKLPENPPRHDYRPMVVKSHFTLIFSHFSNLLITRLDYEQKTCSSCHSEEANCAERNFECAIRQLRLSNSFKHMAIGHFVRKEFDS